MIEVRAVLATPPQQASADAATADAAASPFLTVLAGQLAGDGRALGAGDKPSAATPSVDSVRVSEDGEEPADAASAADAVAALALPAFMTPTPAAARQPAAPPDAPRASARVLVPADASSAVGKAQPPSEAAAAPTDLADALGFGAERSGGAAAAEIRAVSPESASESASPSASASASAPAPTGAAHAVNVHASNRSDAPPTYATVHTPVHQSAFGREVGERVAVFVRDGVQSAELRVTPADLGPVTVRIDLSGTEASVAFTVAHADTREALQDALPRLRELLEANGIQLADASVSGQGNARDDARGHGEGRAAGAASGAAEDARPAPTAHVAAPRGLVDIYA